MSRRGGEQRLEFVMGELFEGFGDFSLTGWQPNSMQVSSVTKK